MADRPEENGLSDTEGKEGTERPQSERSKDSAESRKSIQDAVSKLTVKALKEFRLSDPSDVDTVVTGGESEGLFPTATLTQEIPTFDPRGVPGAQTLLSEGISGDDTREDEIAAEIDDGDDEDLSDEEYGSEGENDMVVLDPDHVSKRIFYVSETVFKSVTFTVEFQRIKKMRKVQIIKKHSCTEVKPLTVCKLMHNC